MENPPSLILISPIGQGYSSTFIASFRGGDLV
jgi:hypothetical protein